MHTQLLTCGGSWHCTLSLPLWWFRAFKTERAAFMGVLASFLFLRPSCLFGLVFWLQLEASWVGWGCVDAWGLPVSWKLLEANCKFRNSFFVPCSFFYFFPTHSSSINELTKVFSLEETTFRCFFLGGVKTYFGVGLRDPFFSNGRCSHRGS